MLDKEKEVYKHSLDYAKDNNEIDLFRSDKIKNSECVKAIDNAVRNNFDGMRLNKESCKDVIDKFGAERVILNLANTLQEKNYDGRFSRENKEWASNFDISEYKKSLQCSDYHPAVLDGFIDQARVQTIAEYIVKESEKSENGAVKISLTDIPKEAGGSYAFSRWHSNDIKNEIETGCGKMANIENNFISVSRKEILQKNHKKTSVLNTLKENKKTVSEKKPQKESKKINGRDL